MRIVVRPYRRVVTAVLATLLTVGAALVVARPMAAAQPPAVDAVVLAPPLTTAEKAQLMAVAEQARARQTVQRARARAAAIRQARALQVHKLRVRIVTVAKRQIGDRYSAGATGPSAFDCSGLTRYVYKVATGKDLPHQSRAQYARVKKIKRADAKPGDLVFFFRGGAHHVGVYIGNGRMVDAAGYGKGVRISPITGSWWSRTYSGMGRLLPA